MSKLIQKYFVTLCRGALNGKLHREICLETHVLRNSLQFSTHVFDDSFGTNCSLFVKPTPRFTQEVNLVVRAFESEYNELNYM